MTKPLAPHNLMSRRAFSVALAPTALLMDEPGKVGTLYGAKTPPHMYFVQPQGQRVYAGVMHSVPSARVGNIQTATNDVRQALTESLGGKPVSAATSRA